MGCGVRGLRGVAKILEEEHTQSNGVQEEAVV